jgi:hypothetical protein
MNCGNSSRQFAAHAITLVRSLRSLHYLVAVSLTVIERNYTTIISLAIQTVTMAKNLGQLSMQIFTAMWLTMPAIT